MDFINPAKNPAGFAIFILVDFAVVMTMLVRSIKRAKQNVLTGGMTGGTETTGTVTWIGHTNTFVNDEPRMKFRVLVKPPRGGAPYEAQFSQVIPYMLLEQVGARREVALLVDPEKPSRVRIDLRAANEMTAGPDISGRSTPI